MIMLKTQWLKNGTPVKIHSLGNDHPGIYDGIIRGVSSSYVLGVMYIVEVTAKFYSTADYDYDFITIPSACIAPIPMENFEWNF